MSMVDSDIRRVIVPDAALEVEVRGSGEPVVLIRTALIADEFEPIASTLRRRADHTIVLYHRRGMPGAVQSTGRDPFPRTPSTAGGCWLSWGSNARAAGPPSLQGGCGPARSGP